MGSLSKPRDERGQFGLPRRVWYIIGGCFTLFFLSRFLISSPNAVPEGHYTAPTGLLTAKDYLNASTSDPAPFDFCPVFGPGDAIAQRRGQIALLKSRVHTGTGARLQRVIQKAMSGHPVTISVLGGSISACHGAGDDPLSPRCWPSKFFEWWNSVFPHPLSELTNGAARRTDSAYFAYCSNHHLPDETDIVILEFDASDPYDPRWMDHFELLVRSILLRPEQPAVILLGHFAPQVLIQNGFAGPELLHDIVAQYYDVPHISAKGTLYHEYMLDPEGTRRSYYSDMVLASPTGHDLMSDLLISFMQSQICSGWSTTMGHAFDVPYMGAQAASAPESDVDLDVQAGGVAAQRRALRVPKARLHSRPSDILTFREVSPSCNMANPLINPLPPCHFYGHGWTAVHKVSIEGEENFWQSETVGANMRIPFNASAGEVAIYYYQYPHSVPAGRVACWVDDDYANRVELSGNANVEDTVTTITNINENVPSGQHYVECVMQGTKHGAKSPPFRMLGVFST